jgi:hypothetical protein
VPGLGATSGRFQLSAGWRIAKARTSYFDSRINHDFTRLWQPRERLSILDVTGRYTINKRLSIIGALPVVFNRFSTLLPPLGNGIGERHGWSPTGVGDTTLFAQCSLLNQQSNPFQNVSVGLGMKIPTGSWNLHATIPDETGRNPRRRSMYPPAILPGDGGVGILAGYDMWKILRAPNELRGLTVFSSAIYLINARNTNGTPSMVQSLGVPLSPIFLGRLTNSVTDSYSMTAGASMRLPGTWNKPHLKGLRPRVAWHWEGTPTYDLIGGSGGFRQPGCSMSFAPGLTYASGKNFLFAEVPIVFWRHISTGATALPGLPTATGAPARFNPNRQMGLVAPVSVAVRYVRSF